VATAFYINRVTVENAKIIVNQTNVVTDAITSILKHHTANDLELQPLVTDIKMGRLHYQPKTSGYKECFNELSVKMG